MTSDDRARIGATLGIGLGILSVSMVVASPSGSIWPAILGGVAIVVSLGTFYRLRKARGESER